MWKAYVTLGIAFALPYGYLAALGAALGLTLIPSERAQSPSVRRVIVVVRTALLVPATYLILALFVGTSPNEDSLRTIFQCDLLQIPICSWALLLAANTHLTLSLNLAVLGVSMALAAYSLVQIIIGRVRDGYRNVHVFFVLSTVTYAFPLWIVAASGSRPAYAFLVQVMVVLFQVAVITGASSRITRTDNSSI
jgi:hypothetical protein